MTFMGNKEKGKALIIGGSNGIGLAVSKILIERGFSAVIMDRSAPDRSLTDDERYKNSYTYTPCDLLKPEDSAPRLSALAKDADLRALMITAGFGRVAEFQDLGLSEIKALLTVNTIAGIEITRIFYDRISAPSPFFTGLMVSIAGLVSSPLFSVYAASKAALMRFIESVNVEIEMKGSKNRILNVSPGSIRGTRFNGGENDGSLTRALAEQIVAHLFSRDTLFIPEYQEVYRDVLNRYHSDPHAFGVSSYEYKKNSGRLRRQNTSDPGNAGGGR